MISVVMAIYNGEKYIEEQMDSIRMQTLATDELVICDDCSTDKTVDIVIKYIERYELKNWRLIKNETNLGYFDNFFKAISLSNGDFIYLSDQDDIWDQDKIKSFQRIYGSNKKIMMIQSDVSYIDGNGITVFHNSKYHGKQEMGLIKLETSDMCKFCGSGFTMSFRRCIWEAIDKGHLQDEKAVYLYHDILLGLMAAARGECLLNKNIVDQHRLHFNNTTQTEGKIYVSDRTKEKQLKILCRREKEFSLLFDFCIDDATKRCFEEFYNFAHDRTELIKHFSIRSLFKVVKRRKYYSSKFGILTDIMYSLGFEKILIFLFSRIH